MTAHDGTNAKPCKWCAYANEHGWWGESGMTHCRDCHATWSGTRLAHCAACHRTFGGVSGFDDHRKDGQCIDPGTLKRPQHLVPHPKWGTPIWRQVVDADFKEDQ